MPASPFVSIVLPAHNEAEGLASAVAVIENAVAQCSDKYELILVDDGSLDDTYFVIQDLASRSANLRGLRLSRNFGKEAALLAGLEDARGDVVITMDADLQHPPELIPQFLERWRRGYQIVSGVKSDRSSDSKLTRWRARLFNQMLRALGGVDVQDSSDYKLLDRLVVDILVKQLPERNRFYRGLSVWVGFKQATIPFVVANRAVGQSKWSLIKLIDLAATAILSFTTAPLRIVTFLGFVTLAFGAIVAFDALRSWYLGHSVSGFVTTIISLLITSSFIMISLGIIGEYVAKIYEEIKARPVYLVTSRCGVASKPSPANPMEAEGR